MAEEQVKEPWKPRHKVTIVVAICAAVIGFPVSVGAATGQLVNITDPVTSSYSARVDSAGALRTSVYAGNLNATIVVPKVPFVTNPTISNYYNNGGVYRALTPPTTATVAFTHIALGNSGRNPKPWEVYLRQVPGATTSECLANTFYGRLIGRRDVGSGQTLAEDYSTPLVLKPLTSGQSWCLIGGGGPLDGSTGDANPIYLTLSGFTAAGTFNPGPANPAAAAAAPQSGSATRSIEDGTPLE